MSGGREGGKETEEVGIDEGVEEEDGGWGERGGAEKGKHTRPR
jgi:hypothetical protein